MMQEYEMAREVAQRFGVKPISFDAALAEHLRSGYPTDTTDPVSPGIAFFESVDGMTRVRLGWYDQGGFEKVGEWRFAQEVLARKVWGGK